MTRLLKNRLIKNRSTNRERSAPMAVQQLPLGAESDRWAWSRYGGSWRLVKVVYPKVRPGWGRPRGQARRWPAQAECATRR